jgi:hypothetical protein
LKLRGDWLNKSAEIILGNTVIVRFLTLLLLILISLWLRRLVYALMQSKMKGIKVYKDKDNSRTTTLHAHMCHSRQLYPEGSVYRETVTETNILLLASSDHLAQFYNGSERVTNVTLAEQHHS